MAIINNTSDYLNKLEYSSKSVEDQAEIDALITAGQALLEEYCQRKFESATYTDELYNGNQEDTIFIANPPLTTLTTVKLVTHADISTNDSTTSYDSTYFLVHENQGRIDFRGGRLFPLGRNNIKITYVGGWAVADIPEPLKLALSYFVMDLFDPTLTPGGMQKEKLGNYFYDRGKDYFEQLPINKKKMIQLYKLRKLM